MNLKITCEISEMAKKKLNGNGIALNSGDLSPVGVVCTRAQAMGFVNLPGLRWIHIMSAGYDDIDIDLIKEKGIILTNARGVYSIPLAEDIILKMLMLARRYHCYAKGKWNEVEGQTELCGKTALIFGAGSIGMETGRRLAAFGMNVRAYDPAPGPEAEAFFRQIETRHENIPALVNEADYIILCLPLNAHTHHFIDSAFFGYMKATAFIVNVSRGGIINTENLLTALKQRRIMGAALDVYEQEPLPDDSELWALDNIILTPHQAYCGDQNGARNEALWAENAARLNNGQELLNRIV